MDAPTPIRSAADLVRLGPVIPVVVLDDAADAVPLARALLRGGVRTMEITLRTPAALPALREVATRVPEMVVGAGTVLTAAQVDEAAAAGARFLVSPGATARLTRAALDTGLPYLPGAGTVGEMMALAEAGLTTVKFFPAAAAGGPAYLAALSQPLPDLTFCPTGGVSADTAPRWLALPNVACVGGSWLTPAAAVRSRDEATLTALARRAAALGSDGGSG
ncbi:bifunctional 4-hydroxy-2-oxoglutarate aldolase/2-dehydro-3-deoxy-phosphogluconate aldolase [Micromonospora globbae]|jgi:2-dehydro-3-deoxyphosphogluconate aldolase/(4S)-4-hydroxy-2-oxoglutarate aldolase|uniref:2-dehydro-3-deoxy-phosphogluconate aldolase n=1 Tax=Micromonospora globbae TaxID=1894969 RepID=A0ABZ1SBD9_9ACTN|nr:bifunctional 4-hydroxy-2-oxoglutarate aldolase/2-dehydro-3-deoxy-phosphogluconate aldolase [Micromonospora globbae]WTF83816.1 bifunctional 4-hydroxy-2-oxoglutarate aldolase/2-dehydro-3-deoxy-phosphogluconate aldolase [Micromonospora globbae]